jgi:hypothetical protein
MRRAVSFLIGWTMFVAGLFGIWLSIKRDMYFGALPYSSAFIFAGGVIVILSELADRRMKMITDRHDGSR